MKKPAKAAIINSNVGSINKISIIKIYPIFLLVAIRQQYCYKQVKLHIHLSEFLKCI
jgi:hypothetical protein